MKISGFLLILIAPICLTGQLNQLSEKLSLSRKTLEQKKPEEALAGLKELLKNESNLSTQDSIILFELLGQCYTGLKQFENAVKNYEHALSKVVLHDSVKAIFYDQLGRSLYRVSEYGKATVNIIQARDLYRKLYGMEDKNYTSSLNTLGFLYNIQGKYSDSEKIFLEAKQINFRLTGGENIQYARIINNLADVYNKLNRFGQAEELYKTSLRIKEKLSGKQSRDFASTLYNFANFQANLGRYEKAKVTFQEGIDIYTALKETNHPDYLKFLDNMAILAEKTGNSQEAERLYKEALSRREHSGENNLDVYALNLINLGKFYVNQSKPNLALPLLEKAVSLTAKIYGVSHPIYAGVLASLANIQASKGDVIHSSHNYEEAIRIIQKSLGKDHIENFNIHLDYAKFLRKTGKKSEAIAVFKKIDKIPRIYLKRAIRFLSERELNEKMEEYRTFIQEIYSFLREMPEDPELSVLGYNTSLYYRGFILNNLQRIRLNMGKARLVSDSRDEVISMHRQLEDELNRPLNERKNTEELERKISEMESEISKTLGSLSEDEKEINWEDVQMALGEEDAAIEYLTFPDPRFSDSVYYGALILTRNSESPIFVSLCNESDFAALLSSKVGRASEYVNTIYNFNNRGAEAVNEKKVDLAKLIWLPLQKHLVQIKRAYLVPDGLLNRISISALPTSLETVVADSIELIIVGSTRQVVPSDNTILVYSGMRSMVIGGIDYNNESGEQLASRSSSSQQSVGATTQWQALPWAEKESMDLVSLLKTENYEVSFMSGTNALEQRLSDSLESTLGWRVIHFATHGFFNGTSRDEQGASSNFYGQGMMNSGIVLTGANAIIGGESQQDGLLTAYEISHMDLSKTELVVLSACETALGDLEEVEGVYGLQRAFKLAGAKLLIMSLWQIPDRETKEFMIAFYKNWITIKIPIRQAFYETQKEFRQRFVNPYQWAGFVLLE